MAMESNMKTAHDLVEVAKASIQEVDLEAASDAILSADLLIDVREPSEFASGHLSGAINIPRGLLEFKVTGEPSLSSRDLHIVLYCKTSGRAALSAEALQKMGYLHVQSIAGGYDAWVAANMPITEPSMPDFE